MTPSPSVSSSRRRACRSRNRSSRSRSARTDPDPRGGAPRCDARATVALARASPPAARARPPPGAPAPRALPSPREFVSTVIGVAAIASSCATVSSASASAKRVRWYVPQAIFTLSSAPWNRTCVARRMLLPGLSGWAAPIALNTSAQRSPPGFAARMARASSWICVRFNFAKAVFFRQSRASASPKASWRRAGSRASSSAVAAACATRAARTLACKRSNQC